MTAITPEHALFQGVVMQALRDATEEHGDKKPSREHKAAVHWITHGGEDYRHVCDLAGMDHEFIREKFLAGRINGRLLRAKLPD